MAFRYHTSARWIRSRKVWGENTFIVSAFAVPWDKQLLFSIENIPGSLKASPVAAANPITVHTWSADNMATVFATRLMVEKPNRYTARILKLSSARYKQCGENFTT